MRIRRPSRLDRIAITVGWHRRLLAAGLAAAAVAFGLDSVEPEPPETTTVLVAARDLPGGAPLGHDDLTMAEVPPELVPDGALAAPEAVVGRALAGPVRHGEPLTDVRLVSRALLQGWGDGLVATPVRIADPGVTALVRPGDHVDILASPAGGTAPTKVAAANVPVLTVPATGDGGPLADGALIVVGATSEAAAALAHAAVTSRLSLTLVP